MQECQFRVSCCFWVQKNLHGKYRQNRGKSFPPNIKDREASGVRRPPGGEPLGAHTPWGRGLGWDRAQLGCGAPSWPPTPILRLYILPDAKTLIKKDHLPRKVLSRPSSSISDRGSSDVLPGTLPEGKSSPGASTSSCLPPE